jgi:hypothetical protein
LPDTTILVGRWAPPELADDDRALLLDAGANHIAVTLIETRDQLRTLAVHERQRGGSPTPPEAALAS